MFFFQILGTFFTFFVLIYQMQDTKKDIYATLDKEDIPDLINLTVQNVFLDIVNHSFFA